MKVHVQFHAQLRDLVGLQAVDVDLAEDASVSELLQNVYAKFPALRAQDKNILVGAGVEFVDRNHKLKPAEQISIMPPVQGG
ncbi:MAG TPA: MoaD/ThiS family protein [Chthoniobacterales bacterium]|nr:MoaD/ThiS family protein [Chthoniobacterales bacterium]